MTNAIRQTVTVKAGGIIEIRVPELAPGTVAEVIVLVDPGSDSARAERVRALGILLKETQGLPQTQALTESEIEAEVSALIAPVHAGRPFGRSNATPKPYA